MKTNTNQQTRAPWKIAEEESKDLVISFMKQTSPNEVVTKTTGQYDRVDLESDKRVIEVKVRNLDKQKFDKYVVNEGCILEEIKYAQLVYDNGLYFNLIVIDDVKFFLIWEVFKLQNVRFFDMYCAANTSFGGYGNKVPKSVTLLKIEDAKIAIQEEKDGEIIWVKKTVEEIKTLINNK